MKIGDKYSKEYFQQQGQIGGVTKSLNRKKGKVRRGIKKLKEIKRTI